MVELRTIVCSHVFADSRPVLLVCREDGELLSLCGRSHEADEQYHIVGHSHLVARDPSLELSWQLAEGRQLERVAVGAPWAEAPLE